MHEQVHERAGKEEQVRQNAEEVCAVLGEQEEPEDDHEHDQNPRERVAWRIASVGVVSGKHVCSSSQGRVFGGQEGGRDQATRDVGGRSGGPGKGAIQRGCVTSARATTEMAVSVEAAGSNTQHVSA
jgi:hypothetical protein